MFTRRLKKKSAKPRWFSEQAAKKRSAVSAFFRFCLILVILAMLLFAGSKVWQVGKKSLWDGRGNLNLAAITPDQLVVVSYQPFPPMLVILKIQPQVYVSLSRGFGDYPVSSIWPLGELEPSGGGELLKLSTQNFLQIPVQGWARLNFPLGEKTGKRELLGMIFGLLKGGQTNLNLWDLLRLAKKINALPGSKIKTYSLDKTRASEIVTLADGSQAFRIQEDYLENLVVDLFSDQAVLGEGYMWEIFNATDKEGLAARVANLVHNIGGEVLVSPITSSIKGGIYCQQKEICQSYSAKLLAKTFNLPVISEKIPDSRGEAVIVLDQNYWKFFYER